MFLQQCPLLSLEALRARNINVLGVILNTTLNQDFQNNLIAIEWYGKTTVLANIPKLNSINTSSLLKVALSDALKALFKNH